MERDIVEIDISTRPDCVSGEYLEVLDRLRAKRGTGICLELGLQTVNYHTLKRMNRGHSLAEFIDAVLQAKAYGFQVCAHVILNYPGDGMEDAVETARILSALRVDMVKIHSLYIAKNTVLCEAYEMVQYLCVPRRSIWIDSLHFCAGSARILLWSACSAVCRKEMRCSATGGPAGGS